MSPNKTIFVVSPLVPYPPARGVELRIYRLLRWLKSEGNRVVLILSTDSLGIHTRDELLKVADSVHYLQPALRTRLGRRFPMLRRAIWAPLKYVLHVARSGTNATTISTPESVNQTKSAFAPRELVDLVGRLAREYRPNAVIAEYIYTTPVFRDLPVGIVKIVDTIDVFSRKAEQVLAFGIADPLACGEDEEREYLLLADVIVAIQQAEEKTLRALVPERQEF